MSEKILEVKHLGKAFGSNQVLRDIDFSVSPGDVTCIIGPSGSGKSTLLRCLNMLETPSTGEINYHGTDITSKNVNVPEYRSKVGMVFQNFNLFPHYTVMKNIIDAPIHVDKVSRTEAVARAEKLLAQLGLSGKGFEKEQRRGREKSFVLSGKSRYGAVHQRQTQTAFRRSETACGNRKSPCHGTGNSSFRRANLRAGSPDGRRGSGGYERPCTRRPDHDHRHP